jgi:signal transduction histidine kinase/ligand-binding sensor domain-containing protein/DNA-binding response OmpR family regulator
MKMCCLKWVICALCLTGSIVCLAADVMVSPLPLTGKLPTNSVRRIFQDSQGYIWMGTTDGLCRYDGYRFLTFMSNAANPRLLTNNFIECIAEDASNLLIGTEKGLNLLNKNTYNITPLNDAHIRDSVVVNICIASDKDIWVGTTTALFRFDEDYSFVKKYDELPVQSVTHIFQDSKGRIWIAVWEHGLFCYDPTDDRFEAMPPIGKKNNPFRIFEDDHQQLWVGTWGDGLFLMNPNSKERIYTAVPLYSKEKQKEIHAVYGFVQDDHSHCIWAMSYSGLHGFEYDADNRLQAVDLSSVFQNYNNVFSDVIKDNKGNLWIGTFSEGVLQINFNKPIVQNYDMPDIKKHTNVVAYPTSLYKYKDELWFNQNRFGLCSYNITTKKLNLYNYFSPDFNLSNIGFIRSFSDYPDELWLAQEYEPIIYRVKQKNNQLQLVNRVVVPVETQVVSGRNVRFMIEDQHRNIWIASAFRLFVLTADDKKLKTIPRQFNSITGITEDICGNIWLSSNDGLDVVNISHDSIATPQRVVNNLQVTTICGDRNGQIWFATQDGRVLTYNTFNKQTNDLSQIIKLSGEKALNFLNDDMGNIWISTVKRIIVYNPVNQAFRDYNDHDGVLVNSFFTNACYKDNEGNLLFGGNRGVSIFSPIENLSGITDAGRICITDVKINNQSLLEGSRNRQFDIAKQTLNLTPKDFNIEIDFSSLNYSFSSKVRYAYKMEGVDYDWSYTDQDRQFAFYNHLDKGKYQFRVKATNENGIWDKDETILTIYRHPAFYETTMAYFLYLIIIGLIIYYTYRTVKNRIKLINELKIAQIDKDKSEELMQTKLRYFTNISHDLLTPLTIISCAMDEIENKSKEYIPLHDIMRSNISRLKRLLQQVLDFRKMETGNMKLKLSEDEIVAFVRNICYTNFSPLIEKKKINFSFDAYPEKITAWFDPDKIDKVIFNLLSNAFKYTPDDGYISVVILGEQIDGKTKFVKITVSDTGKGISSKDLPNIFTRFFNNNDTLQKETNGIGLSLTKDLIELHHGTIDVESKLHEGTTFTVTIPVDKTAFAAYDFSDDATISQPETVTAHIDQALQEEDNKPKTAEDITLLIAEDNEELRMLVANAFRSQYKVLTANNGQEALNIIQEQKIDILVSDIMMPLIDGLALCRRLKGNFETSHIIVLLLTAKNQIEDRVECYDAGADAYISKPFEMQVLKARVVNLLRNKQQRQTEFISDANLNLETLEYHSIDESFLEDAVKLINKHIDNNEFDVNNFAENMNMSKSTLYRKIKALTGLSPIEFILNVRMKHACKLLKDDSMRITEVAYATGFSDPKYFSLCFKNTYNLTPSEYQKQQ